jgi:hypothetical protein
MPVELIIVALAVILLWLSEVLLLSLAVCPSPAVASEAVILTELPAVTFIGSALMLTRDIAGPEPVLAVGSV